MGYVYQFVKDVNNLFKKNISKKNKRHYLLLHYIYLSVFLCIKKGICFSLQSEWTTLLHLTESCKAMEAFVLVFDWLFLKSWNFCLLLPTHVVDYPCECLFSGVVVNFIFISLMYFWNAKRAFEFCVMNNSEIWMFAGFGSLGLMTSVLVCIRFLLKYFFSSTVISIFYYWVL